MRYFKLRNSLFLVRYSIPPTSSAPSRSFNSAFQPSSTRPALCIYAVSIAPTITLSGGQTGTVSLQTSTTSGGTYTELMPITNGNTGALTIGLSLTNTNVFALLAFVPAGNYVKLVTSGTATMSIIKAQEIIF